MFANNFNDPTPSKVNDHGQRKAQFELERNRLSNQYALFNNLEKDEPSPSFLRFEANDLVRARSPSHR